MSRPREHGPERRTALLEAAGRILRERGAGALSVRGVAEAVDTTTRAIYSLFGSKEGLVRAIYREGFRQLDAHLADVDVTDEPLRDLFRLGLAYRAAALANPHYYDVMFNRPVPEFVPGPADRQLSLGTLERLRRGVERCVEAGLFPDGEADALTLQLWALAHGLAQLELDGLLGPPDRARAHWRAALRAAGTGYAATT